MIKRKWVIFIVVLITIIAINGFFIYNYSKKLQDESWGDLFKTKNRTEAIRKHKLAGTIWPFWYFDKGYQNHSKNLNELSNRIAIIIYFKEGTEEEKIEQLENELQKIRGVKEVKYVTKEELLQSYKERNKDNKAILELLPPDNIFPASMEIYLNDFTIRNEVEQAAKTESFVESVLQVL